MSMPATSTKTTKLATSLIDEYALLGWRAMLTEVNLSPKPGLVDRINCGAHKDMALEDFHRSAVARGACAGYSARRKHYCKKGAFEPPPISIISGSSTGSVSNEISVQAAVPTY